MAFTPTGSGSLLLYRLRLPTLQEPVTESLGDDLEASSTGLTRVGRPSSLTFFVRGINSDLPDAYTVGQRLRRQLRSLMENTAFKSGGLYLSDAIDTELSGWYLIGGADLSYGDGGFTLSDYVLTLRSALKIGGSWTHRTGRRFTVLDRRLVTTPIDYRCIVYNGAYTLYPSTAIVWLPYNITEVRQSTRLVPASLTSTGMVTIDADVSGSLSSTTPVDTQSVSFEQSDANRVTGSVTVHDRRTFTSPSFTAAGDIDPQNPTTGYGWEEVYGPVYPYSTDMPVIANGMCRVRWLSSPGCLAVDWNKNTRNVAYTEMCRVLFYDENVGTTSTALTLLQSAELIEYTDERAVIKATVANTSLLNVQDIYVTVQRGWVGPRIEQYTSKASQGSTMNLIPFISGATTLSYRHNGSSTTISTTATLIDYVSSSVGDEPWFNLSPVATGVSMVGSVHETGLVVSAVADTTAYGATRNGVVVKSPYNAAAAPIPVPYWNGVKLDFYTSGTLTLATAQAFAGNAMQDARAYRTVVSRA